MPRRSGRAVPQGHPSPGAAARLSDLLSASVRARALTRRFAAGDLIVVEGEPGLSVFILLEGVCQVSVHGDVLSQVIAGEVFGEIAGLERSTRTATVRATADSTVLEIAATDLRSELRRSPALLDRFLRAMAGRVRSISRRETVARDEHRNLRRVRRAYSRRSTVSQTTLCSRSKSGGSPSVLRRATTMTCWSYRRATSCLR